MNPKMIAIDSETGEMVNPFFCVATNPLSPTRYIDAGTRRDVKITFEVSELLETAEQIPVMSSVSRTSDTPEKPKTWSGVFWECSVQAVTAAVPIAKKIVVDAVTEAVKQNGKELAAGVLKGYSENGANGAFGAAKAGAQKVAEDAKVKAVADVRKKTHNLVNNCVEKI
jgi:hypothetical protein